MREKQARLLAETFHDDWAAGPAADFARRAAACARRHRRVRQIVIAAAAASVVAITGSLVWHQRGAMHSAALATAVDQPQAAGSPRGYEVISDEQFLAQLRDRPILVVTKKDGTREFVLLAE